MPKATKNSPEVQKVSQNTKKSAAKVKATSKVIAKPPTFSKNGTTAAKGNSVQPKKPATAYAIFSGQMQSQMKEMKKFAGLSFAEKSKVVSESWAKLSDQQKSQYTDLAAEDKGRYDKECAQLKKKGYFIDKDGNDSRKVTTKKTSASAKRKSSSDQEMKDQTKTAKTNKKAAPKADDGGVKPKQAMTAYMFYMQEQFSITKKSNPDLKMVEVSKQNSAKWGTLSDKQKEKYVKLNEKDKVRFEKEMKQYEKQGWFINSDGVNSKCLTKSGRVLDFEANTVLPKKVKTSFMFFHAEYFQKNKNADAKINVTEMSKKIGAEWGTMTSKQKAKYENLSKKDETRYNNQIKELKDNGYFIMEDGSKSSDHQKKIKVKRDKK